MDKKDFVENNTVDGNNPINWEEVIKNNAEIDKRKRPLLNIDVWEEIRDEIMNLADRHANSK